MFPKVNLKATGANLRRLMEGKGITAKDVKEYLNLSSVQSVYYWWNGTNMPTVDNLYALSRMLQVPIDELVCGTAFSVIPEPLAHRIARERRMYLYIQKLYFASFWKQFSITT